VSALGPERHLRVPVGDLGPGETRFFRLAGPDAPATETDTGFVVNHDGQLYAWVNRCPHVPYSLDFGDARFMTADGRAILCSSHGAQFHPASGHCFLGPPRGRSLTALALRRDGDDAVITVPAHLLRGW